MMETMYLCLSCIKRRGECVIDLLLKAIEIDEDPKNKWMDYIKYTDFICDEKEKYYDKMIDFKQNT